LHLVIIWVLWLATAADAAQFGSGITDCSYFFLSVTETSCRELQAIEGFAFLIWMLREFTTVCFMSYPNLPLVNFAVMVYSIIVLVMAIIGSSRGHKTWTNSVKNANFLGPTEGAVPPAEAQPAPPQPPMQQHQYPPPNSPSQGYSMPPIPPVSPHHGTQGSHGSQLPPRDYVQGPAYV
jgi:hypothetical protein